MFKGIPFFVRERANIINPLFQDLDLTQLVDFGFNASFYQYLNVTDIVSIEHRIDEITPCITPVSAICGDFHKVAESYIKSGVLLTYFIFNGAQKEKFKQYALSLPKTPGSYILLWDRRNNNQRATLYMLGTLEDVTDTYIRR